MSKELEQFIAQAIKEDIGDGDHTSKACVPLDITGRMKLLVKQKGVLAGVSIAEQIFYAFDENIKFETILSDGTKVDVGDVAFYVSGPEQILLQAERLVLNVMQRMSGIATETNVYVETLKGTKTKILDTRKTTPLNRFLEKKAVKIGGGDNHRIGLYDMIMIKDNHVDFAGGITNAVNKVQAYLKANNKDLKVEVEVRDFDELKEALTLEAVDRIMLDNFTVEDTVKALGIIDGKVEVESSGGITLETIRGYAETGVDFISVGALTHQIKSLDLSLKAVE